MVPRRPGDLAIYYASPKKAWELMAWKAMLSIREVCASNFRWQNYKKAFLESE